MRRNLMLLAMLVIALGGVINPALAGAQAGSVSVEDQLLTVAEGDGWNYAVDAEGTPIESVVPMMVNGEPQLDFAPTVLDMYKTYELQDAYAWSADLVPDYYEPIATTIEIRVMTFSSQENAAGFLDAFYGQLMELSAPEVNLTAIDPLPQSALNMLGVTSTVEFSNYSTDESLGYAGSARYLAQIDSTVISVDVAGPFVDYNFDIAYLLLDAQASCVEQGRACDPVAVPTADGTWTLTERGIVFQTEGEAENEWARWIFPLENPVTAPQWSATLP